MYCILKNTCKHEYKCCNFCKQNCVDRCCDQYSHCKFYSKTEPCNTCLFTSDKQDKTQIKNKEKQLKQNNNNVVEKQLISSTVSKQTINIQKPKLRVKKKLI